MPEAKAEHKTGSTKSVIMKSFDVVVNVEIAMGDDGKTKKVISNPGLEVKATVLALKAGVLKNEIGSLSEGDGTTGVFWIRCSDLAAKKIEEISGVQRLAPT